MEHGRLGQATCLLLPAPEANLTAMSIRLSNMGQDQDLHIYKEELENSMKLILIVVNFARVECIWTRKQSIETRAASSLAKNTRNDNSPIEFGNESIERKLNENIVIMDIVIVKKVGRIWDENISRSLNKL